MGFSIFSCSSSGWASTLRLFCMQGVEDGELWGLLRAFSEITHRMPLKTARHRYVLSGGEDREIQFNHMQKKNQIVRCLKDKGWTYWWSSLRQCTSIHICWIGCWRWEKGCQGRLSSSHLSHEGVSSAKPNQAATNHCPIFHPNLY